MKVAAYCRVSTDKEDQANSFESQQCYFRAYIERQPDWALYRIYADEGVTGTSTKKRAAFQQMLQDAHTGKFQLILTKEVSRFSRNILDTIAYTRDLKQLGIGVVFVNDAINTLEPDAELRLSIMGSIAQEESRKTSSRVKWGQTRQMEKGVVFGRSLLGYDVKGGRITVNPEGAELVRLIFQKYAVEKKGATVIARELQEAGYQTHHGSTGWSSSHIMKILKNEKYAGDLVQKKSITPDYLTHSKKANHGEEPMVVIQNHHPPLVDRDLWNLTQAEIAKRSRHRASGTGGSNLYIFSGKIKCGACGANFVSRTRRRKNGSCCRYWCCYTAVREGKRRLDSQGRPIGCDLGRCIRESLAMEMLKQVLASLQLDRTRIVDAVTEIAVEVIKEGYSAEAELVKRLESRIFHTMEKKEAVMDAFFSQMISAVEMKQMNERYDRELTDLRGRLDAAKTIRKDGKEADIVRNRIYAQISAIMDGTQTSAVFWKNLLDHMTVCQNGLVEVSLRFLPYKWRFLLE